MKQNDLIKWKLEQITQTGRIDIKDIIKFIEDLLANPEQALTEIKIDMHANYQKRQVGQIAYKQKLDADTTELATLDIAEVVKEAKPK